MGHAVATTEPTKEGVVRCDACPVLCRIRPGKAGACDRYANVEGVLTRVDPLVITEKAAAKGEGVIPFLRSEEHTSELQSLMRISYAVFCLKKKTTKQKQQILTISTIQKYYNKTEQHK